jgi:hypothetical protein
MNQAGSRAGKGWIIFAGIMLVMVGTMNILDGVWAIRAQDTALDTIFFKNNLEAWGWFYLILGIVIFAAGVGVFRRSRWAIAVGVAVAAIGAVLNMFWIFQYPVETLVLVGLQVLVLYGLIMYGEESPSW